MMPAYDRLIYRHYAENMIGKFLDGIHDYYKNNEIKLENRKEICVWMCM